MALNFKNAQRIREFFLKMRRRNLARANQMCGGSGLEVDSNHVWLLIVTYDI